MMENIRAAANSVVVKIIFGIIILSFIFAGLGGIFSMGSQDDKQYIVTVNGEGLSRTAYENRVRAEIQKNNIDHNQVAQIHAIRQQVIKQQIDSHLLYLLADHLGITVSNEQIKDYIRHQPLFFENGGFSNERYLGILTANGLTPDTYAKTLRTGMSQQQLAQGLLYSDFVLPIENQIGTVINQKRTVSTALLTANNLNITNRTFTDEELQAYYKRHAHRFNSNEERIKLAFIRLPRAEIAKKIVISDKQLQRYFNENKSQYREPVKMAYSVIETDSEKKAESLYNQLLKGDDFGRLASEASLYPIQRKSNGFVGWFTLDEIPDAFKIGNLSKVGTFTRPLKQQDGHYLLVRLDNKQNETVPALETVVERVKRDILHNLTNEMLQKVESQIQILVNQGIPLADIAKKVALKQEESSWLTQRNAPLIYPTISELVTPELGSNNYSQVLGPAYVEEDESLYVLQIVNYRPAGIIDFASVKNDIQIVMQQEDRQARFEKMANRFIDQLSLGDDQVKKKITFSKPETITRDNQKYSSQVINMIFDLIPPTTPSPRFGITFLPNEQAMVASLFTVEKNDTKVDVKNNLLLQWVSVNEESINNMLFSKAKIKVLPDTNIIGKD